MNLSFLVHSSARNHKQTFWKKIKELENINGIVEKLDAHYGFFYVEILLQFAKLLYFLRTIDVLIIQFSWRNMTKPCATGFPKCVK